MQISVETIKTLVVDHLKAQGVEIKPENLEVRWRLNKSYYRGEHVGTDYIFEGFSVRQNDHDQFC